MSKCFASGLAVLDTNALFGTYRLNGRGRKEFLDNRHTVVKEYASAVETFRESVEKAKRRQVQVLLIINDKEEDWIHIRGPAFRRSLRAAEDYAGSYRRRLDDVQDGAQVKRPASRSPKPPAFAPDRALRSRVRVTSASVERRRAVVPTRAGIGLPLPVPFDQRSVWAR
ncbi:hypothetical protein [Actinomadura sp. NPDC048394]|uniref:hypothetical protein n=1 Tax=Actinomadura sp. NPDC048394 TaxID=3158223 RepID=UPI0033EDA04A